MKINIVILAAGKGSRMKSQLPKVLQPLAKRPLLAHVLDTSFALEASKIVVVRGHGGEQVKDTMEACFPEQELIWVEQTEQLGTGHAVLQAVPHLDSDAVTLILYGDVPLISAASLRSFIEQTQDGCGLLSVELDNPTGYGRIIRTQDDKVIAIVEQKDATSEQLAIKECNSGIMLVKNEYLAEWLPNLGNNNAQGEYYLTDIVAVANQHQVTVNACRVSDPIEVEGVNDRLQLAALERSYQRVLADEAMRNGVALADPGRIDIRGSLQSGTDCYIDVNAVIEGDVTLGSHVSIGPNCQLINCRIGDGSVIKANSVIEDAIIGEQCDVGPFARIRPGTELKNNAKVGNFVETKKAVVGEGSKINHLSYVGDAELGSGVNVGAGTITCNYDGVNKWKTIIGDDAFIGSNSSLVAPVTVGAGATVGAGSTVSRQLPEHKLTLTRAKQITIESWKRPTKQ